MANYILGIETSCDDTSAAVLEDNYELSNEIAGQKVHKEYGGVVPELASRAHQQNIIPVVHTALKKAGISAADLSAVAFTQGPGLLGSLLVGTAFAKGLCLARNIPLIGVNHLQGHVLSHFIREKGNARAVPDFPFLNLLVSGGHSQIIVVRGYFDMEVIGTTIDDAAGEAFDKSAKVMGLPYPGGPWVDKLASTGDPSRFRFARPKIDGLDFSFSGLKTSFLYFMRDELKKDAAFIEGNKADLAASLQHTIISILMDKLKKAAGQTGIRSVAVSGGVSANSGLRNSLLSLQNEGFNVFIPPFRYTTDNAAMIAIVGYYKFLQKDFSPIGTVPVARFNIG